MEASGKTGVRMGKAVRIGLIAGLLGFLVMHQGTLFLLHHYGAGLAPQIGRVPMPYSMASMAPFGLPQVAMLAIEAAIWGVVLCLLLRALPLPDLLTGFAFGVAVIGGSQLSWMAELRGLPWMAGGNEQQVLRTFLLGGVLGWGIAFWARPMALKGN